MKNKKHEPLVSFSKTTANAPQTPNFGLFFEIMLGPVRMAVLNSALEMRIADILVKHKIPEDIAQALNLEAGTTNLKFFLDAMVSMGLIEKKDGTYSNTSFAEAYMRKDSPSYLGGLVAHLSGMQHRNLRRIPALVRKGSSEIKDSDRLSGEAIWKKSVHHLACYQKAGMAARVADILAGLPEFEGMKRLLDIGCGPGIMSMTTISRHPSLEAVLCDLPSVIEVAKDEIAAAGLEDRVSTISGDYNEVDFGTGYDLIWVSHALYYANDLDSFLSRVYNALTPKGIFVSFHEGLTNELTQPAWVILSRLSLSLEGQATYFEKGQIASHLQKVGFDSVESSLLMMPMGPMELVIARKQG